MRSRRTGMHEGYPTSVTTYGLYCDRCGSFRLARRFSLATWAKILAAIAVLGAFVAALILDQEFRICGIPVLVLSLYFALTLLGDWFKYSHLRCTRCGNRQITRGDILSVEGGSGWRASLDTPERRVVTYEEDG